MRHAHLQDEGRRGLTGDGLQLPVELRTAHKHVAGNGLGIHLVVLHLHIDDFLQLPDEVAVGGLQHVLGGLFLLLLAQGLGHVFAHLATLLQQFRQSHLQLLLIERLHQIGVGTGFQTCHAVLFGALGCDDDDRDVAQQFRRPDAAAQFQAVGARHHQVGDDDVGHDVARLGDALVTVLGIEDAVGLLIEQFADVEGHVAVVLDDEHAVARVDGSLVVGQKGLLVVVSGLRLTLVFVDVEERQFVCAVAQWQRDGHRGAFAPLALAVDGAVHGFHNLPHQRKSDACADALGVALGLIECLEDVWQRFLGNARTVVADHEAQCVGCRQRRLHVHAALWLGVLETVGEQIDENLLHVVGHEVHLHHVLLRGVDEFYAFLLSILPVVLDTHADEGNDVAVLPVGIADGGFHLRYVEQLVDEVEQVAALSLYGAGVVLYLLAVRGGLANLLGQSQNDRERCAELVGDVGEEAFARGLHVAQQKTFATARAQHVAHDGEQQGTDDEDGDEQTEGQHFQRSLLSGVFLSPLQLVVAALPLGLDAQVLNLVHGVHVDGAVVVLVVLPIVVEGLRGLSLAFV